MENLHIYASESTDRRAKLIWKKMVPGSPLWKREESIPKTGRARGLGGANTTLMERAGP